MAQTDRTNFSEVPPSSGGNAAANRGSASAAPSSALTAGSADDNPFATGPMAAAVQAEAMDTAPDFPDRNPNASGVRERRPADLVRPVHPMRRYFVVTVGACVGIFDSQQIGRINLAESQKFSMHQFANWDQAAGFYTAHHDANTLHIAPTAATQDHPIRLFATQHIPVRAPAGSANPGTENHPIFIASTAGSPISVSSTASTPIAATRDAAKVQFALKVPRGGVPVRAQSIGTPTPMSRTLQPFPMPSPSPNFGKATPLPGPPVSTLPKSDAIIIPDSDDEDHTHQKGKSRNVIVIGDDDDDSVLPQKPYPSSPSHPSALPSPMPATPFKGTRRFKPLFAEGYSPSDFFNADGHPDDIAASLNAQKASLRARQLAKIEKYMKTPRTDLRSATQAARTPVNSNAPSTSVLSRDDGYESDYGIPDFNTAGLQELDAILDSLVNGA